MKMRTALASEHVHVRPGEPSMLDVEVTNTADVIDGVTAEFEGLDPSWVQLVSPVVSLFPESTSTLTACIDLPSNCIAGDYLITMHVFSTIAPERRTTSQFWLTVEPAPKLAVQLRPSLISAGSKAEFTALVANPGNVPLQVALRVEEETSEVTCAAEPPVILVEPGQTERVAIQAKGPRPWFGSPVARSLSITTTAAPDIEIVEAATFNQKPRIPRGVLTILILAGIIALWATIFMVIINTLRSGETPAKAVATNFNEGGATDVALLAVAGSASGSVTAKTTGEGLPRITVEARRVARDGSSEPIASAATGDDGSFTLDTLLPGTYKFRFTADGFTEIWYPAATSEGDAELIKVEPKGAAEGIDVVIEGKPASFLGQILAPESAGPVTISVTATLKVETVAEQPADAGTTATGTDGAPTTTTAPPPPPPEFTVTTDGPLELTGLPSPGTYRFRIVSPGFDPLEFDETLEGGETKVLNTVRLGAALGALSGTVTDGNGAPLGGVTVTVSSGEFVKEVTTPTDGAVGAYSIDGLETPNTYVVTFAAEGYATVTRAIDLAAGALQGGVDARLTGGAGTVAGTVTGVGGGAIGGVKITVAGGLFTATSETLTTGSPGAYVVAGIPTPGTYTVTFEAEGYLSETRVVTFSGPGQIPGIDAVLQPATATITGIVSLAGTPSDGVDIELSSGSTPRVTRSASDPAGAYSFTGVLPGTYTITFRRSGFDDQVVLVDVVAGDVISRSVNLT